MPPADERRPSAQVGGAPARAEADWDAGCWILLTAIVALFVLRLPLIGVRVFDNDELEHAHAAWNVSQGLVPYRDFFEHHTPWYHFALAPFFHWFAVDQSLEAARHFLIFGRFLSLALTALSVVLVFLVARLGGSRRVGLWTGLFLAGQPVVMQKTLEIRPDVLALPFFIGALWFLLRGMRSDDASRSRRLRWFLGGGLCLGAAIMCTQKMLFVLPGALVGLGIWVLRGRRTRTRASRVAAALVLLLGVAGPVLVTWMGFALRGAGVQFIYDNFLLNARVRLGSNRALPLILKTSWPILLLCLLGAWSALVARHRAERRDDGDLLLICILGGFVAGIPIVRVAYEQYYLPAMTIVCLFAARGLGSLLARSGHRARVWAVMGAAVALSIWPVIDLRRSLGIRNDLQLARLRFVYAHTGPADRVLDGWLGTNVFRPAPHYYFFMHSELAAMLTESEKNAYLDAVTGDNDRPALIALDAELVALGPRFLRFVHDNYVHAEGVFYLPRVN
ncbi:MAG TPA: glycosyltransferase family 39 protein [Polyangia bacterium]|jgi:4-amino-4-deoxy-L-arabinose transferase-like glycosyltransferase